MTEQTLADPSDPEHGDPLQLSANGVVPSASDKKAARASGPWGPSASIGFTLLVVTVMGAVQEGAAARTRRRVEGRQIVSRQYARSSIRRSPGCRRHAGGCIGRGRHGADSLPREALSAGRVSRHEAADLRQATLAVIGLAVFITSSYSVSWVLGESLEPTMVVDIYRTGGTYFSSWPPSSALRSERKSSFEGSFTRESLARDGVPSPRLSSRRCRGRRCISHSGFTPWSGSRSWGSTLASFDIRRGRCP